MAQKFIRIGSCANALSPFPKGIEVLTKEK